MGPAAGRDQADYVITGEADLKFREVCAGLLEGRPPAARVIPGRARPKNSGVVRASRAAPTDQSQSIATATGGP